MRCGEWAARFQLESKEKRARPLFQEPLIGTGSLIRRRPPVFFASTVPCVRKRSIYRRHHQRNNPPPPKKKQRTTGENHETFSSLRKSSRFFRWVTTSSRRQFPATTLGPFFFGKKDACLRSAMAFRYACISFIGRPLFFFRFGARCDDKSSSLFLFHPGVIFSAVIRWRGRACECVVTQFLWSFSLLR